MLEQKRHQITIGVAVATLLLAVACATGKADKVDGGEELEGWRKIGTIDYFYMRISGSASPSAKRSGEEARMKSTCVESTKLQAKDTIIRKLVGERIQAVSGSVDAETKNHIIISMRSANIRGTEMKECAKRSKLWATCECVHFVRGRNLKKKFQLQVDKLVKQSGV